LSFAFLCDGICLDSLTAALGVDEILGNRRRQTKRVWLELGLRLAVTSEERIIWVADAHRDDGKRFVVRADEKLTAFLELESAIQTFK